MSNRQKIKEELKVWIYYQALQLSSDTNQPITYEDINLVLVDILHENNQHDPKEIFKKH